MSESDSTNNGEQPYSKSPFTELFGRSASIHVMEVFLRKHYTELTVGELVELTPCVRDDVEDVVAEFEEAGFILSVGESTYQLNKKSEVVGGLAKSRRAALFT